MSQPHPSPPSTPPRAPDAPSPRLLGHWFTQARREGLLSSLTPEAWQTLSAVLSFTTRDGQRLFTLDQLALALGTDRKEAECRLEALAAADWQGSPLLTLVQDGEEVAGATLAPLELLAQVEPPTGSEVSSAPNEEPAAGPAAEDEDELVLQLESLGLTPEQIDWLTGHYETALIRRQLGWLPARGARNPAAMLIRAVEGDWAPPRQSVPQPREDA